MKVGIFGAGAIGCYVGGRLAAQGTPVVLLGRASLQEQYTAHGLHVTDCDGFKTHLSGSALTVTTDTNDLADCDFIIVTVKSADTAKAGAELKPVLAGRSSVVVSLQNGVSNANVLRTAGLPHVCEAMVPFNVVRTDGPAVHRGTSGAIVLAREGEALAGQLNAAGVVSKVHGDMLGVLWGKLLLNLNNAINALSGLPIREQLASREFRKIFAASMAEALGVLRKARIKPVAVVGAPAAVVEKVLRLPDFLFFRTASTMLKIDPKARSSMAQDLELGRKTEVDYLNGEIVRLGAEHGIATPLNSRIVELVKEMETKRVLRPSLTPPEILTS